MMIRTLVYWLIAAIVLFAVTSYSVPANHVFHVLNAVAMAASFTTIAAYSPAILDAWRQRTNHVRPAHLLAFGVVTSWSGLMIRLGRWFFTEALPATGGEQWAYNVGLWITIAASGFLIGAVALTEPVWSRSRVCAYAAGFSAIVLALWTFDLVWVGVPHFGPIPIF